MILKTVENIPESDKLTIDAMGLVGLVGVFANILPALSALLMIVWTGIRIYETKTVQRMLNNKTED